MRTVWNHEQIADLSEIRRSRGISLRDVADSTNICMRYLEAIEEGKFQKLPGGIYNTSYIRQYARVIDFDEEEILRYYRAQSEPAVSEAPPAPVNTWRNWLLERLHSFAAIAVPKER